MSGLGVMVMILAASPMVGRPLADALEALRARGVRLIYSSDLVRPGMKVQAEPRSASPRAALDEFLAPHGLRARKGPAGTVLVVKAQPEAPAPLPTGRLRVVAWRRDEQRALAGVGVRINGETRTDATDAEGRVLLAGLRPGLYAVEARMDGFAQERSDAISVAAGAVAELRVEMTPEARAEAEPHPPRVLELSVQQAALLEEAIEVQGEARPAASGPDALQLRPQQVAAVPGTADNLFRALPLWSGVFGVNDVESRIAVRGGGPDQNLVVVDGVEVANPFRLVGLTSMFHPDFLKSFELNRGVLHPRYGDRLSSALVVETRDGNTARRVGGTASLNLIDLQLLLEGRLPETDKVSWLLAARTTWLPKLAGLISAVGDGGPLGFDDLALKLAWEPVPGRRLSLLGLIGRDDLQRVQAGPPNGGSGTADRTRLLSARYHGTWGRRGWLASTLGLYSLEHALQFDTEDANLSLLREFAQSHDPDRPFFSFRRELSLRDLSFRQELGLRGERAELEGGLELHRVHTRFGWITAPALGVRGPIPSGYAAEPFDTTRAAGWLHARLRPRARLLLEPGLRVEHSGGQGMLAPRLFGTLQLAPSLRARASLGIQHQTPGFEKFLLRDTVFESDGFFEAGAAHRLRPERMRQAQLGLERDLGGGLAARAEAYARWFDRLVVGRLETPAEVQARLDRYDLPPELQSQLPATPLVTRVPENAGTGRAYGFELSLHHAEGEARRLAGQASYAFSVAERDLQGATVPFDFDRRHSLNGAATLRLWRRLSLITVGRFGSGFPRATVSGLRVAVAPDAGDADGDGDRDELVPARDRAGHLRYTPALLTPSDRNRSRLPAYARLDVRLAYEPRGQKGLGWYVEWLNVLDRRNPVYVESNVETDSRGLPRLSEEPGAWFPRLFSGGVRWRF